MRVEPLNGVKRFFKDTTDEDEGEYANGLNCRVDGEYIGPCYYGKPWLQKHEINPLDNQFWLINDGDSYNVVLFLPLYILHNLTEEMYSEIIKKFELNLKKAKEQLKLENLKNDF
jgi:hypothetical protein